MKNEENGARAKAWSGDEQQIKLAGAAHDLRNALCIIAMCLELARNAPDHDGKKRALNRLVGLVPGCRRLLEQLEANWAKPETELLNDDSCGELARVVTTTVEAFRAVLPANIEITVKFEANLAQVSDGVCKDMECLLTNLMQNSRDAMPGGGALVVMAGNVSLGADGVWDGELCGNSSHYVRVSVSDTGKGISPDHQAVIFNSIFTTKTGGFGLGLVMVKRLVVGHGGFVTCRTLEGKGTQFNLFSPAMDSTKV
jgi:signal transduction histidine kinase